MPKRVVNQSPRDGSETWQVGDFKYTESIRQEYATNNCVFHAGFVEGAGVDTMFVGWYRDGDSDGQMLLLRPDEMAAIAWCINGVLWSELLEAVVKEG